MNPNNRVAMENDLPRPDVRQKVTGVAKYASDQYPRKILHTRHVRFPYGKGKIKSADLSAARAVPGIVSITLNESADCSYAGHRIGRIMADSLDAIEDAIAALRLEFTIETAITNPDDEYKGVPDVNAEEATMLASLYDRAAAVVEATYTTQVQTHSCLEPHGSTVDHRGEELEAWTSTQAVMGCKDGFQNATGLSPAKIVVHAEYVGGGFGSKFSIGPEGQLAAEASKEYARPARGILNRREEHADGGNRPGSIQYMKIAADANGKLLGGRIHLVDSVGFSGGRGGIRNPMYYNFGEVVRTEGEIALNTGLPMAFRAPGYPQGVFAVESMMDELAAALKMDPVAFRLANETSDRRKRQLEQGAELIGWRDRPADGASPGRIKVGYGCGATSWGNGKGRCQADIDVYRSGEVEVRVGIQDIGTGATAMVADVVAERLGIPRTLITAHLGNSSFPPGPASGGSVTSRFTAPALRDAAEEALKELRAIAGNDEFEWKETCALMPQDKISVRGEFNDEYWGTGNSDGVQFAKVEVDTETGIVVVKHVVAIQACGKPANRLTTENQIYGGVIQGISYALFEERIIDGPTGGHLNPDLLFYKVAGSKDVPEITAVLDWEEGEDGVRSLGEPTTIPTAGVIANAVANAIGARVRDLPITPARVLAALESQKGGIA